MAYFLFIHPTFRRLCGLNRSRHGLLTIFGNSGLIGLDDGTESIIGGTRGIRKLVGRIIWSGVFTIENSGCNSSGRRR